ncbi:hypothetical protein AAG906_011398 [Vitis piasezkii]
MKEETHVVDYVFDESKDPSEMFCAYGGYGYADIVGDPKLCHTGMYVILYMQHWDGSGLNRTINSEFTDKLIEEDEFDAIKRMHLREARKRPCKMS